MVGVFLDYREQYLYSFAYATFIVVWIGYNNDVIIIRFKRIII